MKSEIFIFTDGASSGNPGKGGWGAVIVDPQNQVTELGGGESSTTNNRMELQGVISALEILKSDDPIRIYSDSQYVIQGITKWILNWKKYGWKTKEGKEVLNQDLWQKLDLLAKGKKIRWEHVSGHAGIVGNERADSISVSFSKDQKPSLFQGDLKNYPIASTREGLLQKQAPYYISWANGKLERYQTWAECERSVKGRAGVKFKKVKNKNEEEEVLRSWGK